MQLIRSNERITELMAENGKLSSQTLDLQRSNEQKDIEIK